MQAPGQAERFREGSGRNNGGRNIKRTICGRCASSRLKIATSIKQDPSTTGASLNTCSPPPRWIHSIRGGRTRRRRGEFQFIDRLARHLKKPPQLGYGKYARHLEDVYGTYYVKIPIARLDNEVRDDNSALFVAGRAEPSQHFKLTGQIAAAGPTANSTWSI